MKIRISAIALACLVGMSSGADPRIEQGARFEAKGDYEMALGEYRAILAEDPKNAGAYLAAAKVRMKMKDYSGALANFRLAYKFEPTLSDAYEGAAQVYEALGQKAKAEAERAKDPKNTPIVDMPADVETAAPAAAPAAPEKETVKAEPAKAVEKPAETKAAEPVETAKAAEPAKAEDKAATKAAADSPAALPADPFEKGKALFAEGKYKEAANVWRDVLRKQPGHAGAYFYAGLTRYELGEYDKAEFNLKKGLEYKEEGNDANYFLAMIAQKNKKPEQELKFLAAYMKKAAPTAKYRKAAEERLAAIKAEKEAAKVAAQGGAQAAEAPSEETAPAESVKDSNAGEKVAEAVKETKPAAVPAERDIADAPSGKPTLSNANLLYRAGSIEAALKMYKELLETELPPEERYFAMLQMGNAYRELRDFHSAVVRYREVVQQFPDSDWATEAERALEDAV